MPDEVGPDRFSGFDELDYVVLKGSQIDSPGLDGADASPYLPDVSDDGTEALSDI